MYEYQGFKHQRAVKEGQKVRSKTSTHTGLHFTEREKADIIKRMKNFESPTSIAKFYGVDKRSILYVMNNRKK